MPLRSSMFRKAVLAGTLVTGAGLASAGIAAAVGGSTSSNPVGTSNLAASTSNGSSQNGGAQTGTPPDPATMTHGPNETLLTGTDLQKADAAAQAAVPGATIIRAETDSSGAAPYEVHMKKADGAYVTVELDSSFNAVKTISGFGPGPAGSQPPNGTTAPPNGTSPPNGTTTPSSTA